MLPDTPWEAPEPRALPALRESLVDQTRNPFEHESLSYQLGVGRGSINPDRSNPSRAASILLEDERRRLVAAELWSVNASMTAVAIEAARKMPSWSLTKADLPSEAGLMVFGSPIGEYVDTGHVGELTETALIRIVAVAWGPTRIVPNDTHVWVSFLSATDHERSISRLAEETHLDRDEARKFHYRTRADLSWDNEALLSLKSDRFLDADPENNAVVITGQEASLVSGTTSEWVPIVRAAWHLCKPGAKSRIAEVSEQPVSRTVRRRAEAAGYSHTSHVRVVNVHGSRLVRRPVRVSDGGGGYKIDYQSFVSGHPRWQPYPSLGTTELIWIDEYVRGPEGAPFKQAQPTVHLLDRPPHGG